MRATANIAGHLAYLALCIALALSVPGHALARSSGVLIVIGAIGAWRYGWAVVNFSRAVWYLRVAYPRLKRRAMTRYARRANPAHAYFLITTYKIEPAISVEVYRALFRAAARSDGGATIVASVVDIADERLIRTLFERMPETAAGVHLVVDRIAGTGKRDALARSLRLIARQAPSRHDVVVFVDGDSCVPPDIVARTAPIFTDPAYGALTTDERVAIRQPGLFRDWFRLRFIQRQVMMSSTGLSGRVLTLTGRMSVFRADLATDPDFVRQVQHDHIDHWRLGRVRFVTGDDKSTWFWLLKHGYLMAYLPDVASVSMETQPRPGFVDSAVTLMIRWFGNMLRNSGRALALPPRRIGYFTWWSVLDQRLGIWTTLSGPISIMLTAIFIEPLILPAYLAWILFTRYLYCTILCAFRGQSFPISFPFLLYFGQIVGAGVKSFVLFRLDRQRWTRQSSAASATARPAGARIRALSSVYLHSLTLGWLTLGVLLLTGIL